MCVPLPLPFVDRSADASRQQLPELSVAAMDSNTPSSSSSSCCPDHGSDHHHHHHDHDDDNNHQTHGQHHHASQHHQPQQQDQHQHHHHDTGSSSTTSSGQDQPQNSLSLERMAQIVRFNAFGDAFEDLAAAAVRGAHMPHSHVGCWPAFSLYNHSCIPNTVHYVVGRSMVVRATEDIPAGEGGCGSPSWIAANTPARLAALSQQSLNTHWTQLDHQRQLVCTPSPSDTTHDGHLAHESHTCMLLPCSASFRPRGDCELSGPGRLCTGGSKTGSAGGALWLPV